ncbi:MAG: biotin--[acetyl-CoA-carboxylase] ligase [Bdellovibrionales bacterium]|nr:biotin--[acetyl-CoA-carboxylase] ligase [Bdellovibrionales bacterium]MBT3525138.1 biotin--[acetyl-CoA-carboxylase] ligase [Bdellovibrionales bacterium]MBT7668859.1 biotin--[acetyl-CoA-carboxylase] ligase [Bdellovibrionales bacterium]MBT7766746.1 biotin--[acetyl-CoA-carboxylase] ligase [Bdellovibrionales bacterium]
MIILTDSISFLKQLLGGSTPSLLPIDQGHQQLFTRLTGEQGGQLWQSDIPTLSLGGERELLLAINAPTISQFDQLANLNDLREGELLPDTIVMVAGRGNNFHGYKGRSWISPPGNLYLSVRFALQQKLAWQGREFLALSALSMLEGIKHVAPHLDGNLGIKWVNDVLVDHHKIGGVITNIQSMGDQVCSAVVGIGINVLTPVELKVEDSFVCGATSLSQHCSDQSNSHGESKDIFSSLFFALVNRLAYNYQQILVDNYTEVWGRYCHHSILIGREIEVFGEELLSTSKAAPVNQGRVLRIAPGLELHLEGESSPVTSGRIFLK